ncbi:hypothetical protein NE237_022358 [Protea cynaroides]|uniref:Uncharacterized protein n=1 Tax=Protea cynaroides TaxID=273540 RepID=A0A9Q0K3G0_9MAGN|nr:hypothetical protein NE237_022358 [Protea cynaroides]
MVSSSISTPIRLPATNPLPQPLVPAVNPLPQSPVPRTQPQPQPQALIKTYTQPWISSFQHSPTTRFYLPGKDPPPAKELSIVEKFLPLQLAMNHTFVASKTSVTSTSTLMETKLPSIVKSRRRAEMYGTEPSRCKRRQLFLLVYASTNDNLPNTELWVGLKPPLLLPERLRLSHVALLVLDQADDSDVVSQMRHILESNRSSTVSDQICHDSHKLGFFQVLIHHKINCKDLRDGIFRSDNAKWKEQRPCKIVRSISKGFRISRDERDQPMDAVFLDELCSGIAYKSNRHKVVMSLENYATMKERRAEASIVMFGALDELFKKTGVRPRDIGVLVTTSLGLQVDLEALRMEKLEVAEKKTMYIEGFLSNHVRHRTGNRTGSPNSNKIDRKDRQHDLLDSIMAFFQQEKSAFEVNFLCCLLRSVISYGVGEKRQKVYVPILLLNPSQTREIEKTWESQQPPYATCHALWHSGPAVSLRVTATQYASEVINGKAGFAFGDVDHYFRLLEELDPMLLRASRNDPKISGSATLDYFIIGISSFFNGHEWLLEWAPMLAVASFGKHGSSKPTGGTTEVRFQERVKNLKDSFGVLSFGVESIVEQWNKGRWTSLVLFQRLGYPTGSWRWWFDKTISGTTHPLIDGPTVYSNACDGNLDTLAAALDKSQFVMLLIRFFGLLLLSSLMNKVQE